MSCRNRSIAAVCIPAVLFPALVFSQAPRSSIVGRVADASSSYVAGAKITVENQQTGISRGATTAQEGEFTVPNLDPGLYRVTVTAQGFKTNVLKELAASFFRVRLWTQKELLEALFAQYDHLDDDLKAELPLKRIWTVAAQDDE